MYPKPPGDPDNIPLLDAALYILGKGRSLTVAHSPVTLSNGLDWTEDGKTFYYIDSKADKVVAFDCDPETGKLSNERTVFDKMKNGVDAVLDGMALDRRGNLWVALFYGSRSERFGTQCHLHLITEDFYQSAGGGTSKR